MKVVPDASFGPFQICPVPGLRAHNPDDRQISGAPIDGLTGRRLRPRARGTAGRTSLVNQLHRVRNELPGGRTLCVIVVDMQGETEDRVWTPVIDAQLRVLERAEELQLDIYDVGMGLVRGEGENASLHRQPTTPRLDAFFTASARTTRIVKFLGNAVHGIEEGPGTLAYAASLGARDAEPGATRSPGASTPLTLEQRLRARRTGAAVVMGQEANQCVKSTIFGQNVPHDGGAFRRGYKSGLLDIGVSVISSFEVLFDSSDRLERIYEFELIDEGDRSGPATRSATAAATAWASGHASGPQEPQA